MSDTQPETTVPASADGAKVVSANGDPSESVDGVGAVSPSTGGEPSLEELQQQLQQMEAEQDALAAEFQHSSATPQLDQHLAVIEEQFREGFDERFRTSGPRVQRPVWEDQTDILRTNKIFREVSKDMGDEWRPVFRDLMAAFPPEILDEEFARLDEQPSIIQGYRSLMAWKEIAGPNFTIMKLVDSLRKNDMDDIADVTLNILDERDRNGSKKKEKPAAAGKPVQRRKSDVSSKSKTAFLDNRQMLLLAKKIGGDWEGIGKALSVADEELAEIREDEGSTYQGAFKMLWAWRQTQPPGVESEATIEILKTAFQEAGKGHLADQLQPTNK